MLIKTWLRQSIEQPNTFKDHSHGISQIIFPMMVILLTCAFFLYFAIPLMQSWRHTSTVERHSVLASFAISIPISLLIYYIVPSRYSGMNGWQKRKICQKNSALIEAFASIRSTPPQPFTDEEYTYAADMLKTFRPISLSSAQKQLALSWFEILVRARAIDVIDERVQKIVSTKSILEDRPAGYDEE